MDSLDEARARFPVGSRLTARVTQIIGVAGMLMKIDDPLEAFVDSGCLPGDLALWPQVGDESEFEVLQHRPGQIRLWPLDPSWRHSPYLSRRQTPDEQQSDEQIWNALQQAFAVDDVVMGEVTYLYENRECQVDLGIVTACATWSADDEPPVVSRRYAFIITAILETTMRVLIEFAPAESVSAASSNDTAVTSPNNKIP